MKKRSTRHTFTGLFSSDNLTKTLTIAIIGIALIGLSCAIICMCVARPVGDDFGAINFYRSDVWLTNTIESLKTTGRYGQSVFGAIAYGLFGRNIASILPLLFLTWLIVLVYLYTKQLMLHSLKTSKYCGIATASITIITTFLILFANDNITFGVLPAWISYQYLFWPAGIVTYATPVLLLLSAVYLLFIRKNQLTNKTKIFVLILSTFIVGVFNEVVPGTIIALCAGAIILSFIKKLRWVIGKNRPYYIAALTSSLLAIISLVLSVGSQNRQLVTGANERSIIMVILSTGYHVYVTIFQLFFRPRDIVLFIAFGLLVAIFIKRFTSITNNQRREIAKKGITLGILTIIAMVGSLSCSYFLVAAGYGEHSGIVTRTIFIPQILYVLGLTILFSSVILSVLQKDYRYVEKLSIFCSTLLVCVLMPQYFSKIIDQVNSSILYSNAWTQQEKIINQKLAENKEQTIYLPLSVNGLGVDQTMSCIGSTWLNIQVAEYYGIKKVCSEIDQTSESGN